MSYNIRKNENDKLEVEIKISQEKWEERAKMAGILFDRRRIMEFLPFDKIPDGLINDMNEWNNLILHKYGN